MSTPILFNNLTDPRYSFELFNDGHSTCITQMGNPPNNPIAFYRSVWGQWNRSPTTQERANYLMKLLINANPATKWFKQKVCWVY